nr:SPOR domain-containing protein [uncultured Kingella sp.]
MHAKHQQGKGLFSFLAGSIAALIAIAAVLFTLNSNKERDFKNPNANKQQPAAQNDQTEVLLPSNVPASAAKPTPNTRTTTSNIEDDESIVASTPRTRPPKKREETDLLPPDEEPIISKEKPKKPEPTRRQPDIMDDPVLGDSTDSEKEPPRESKPQKPADNKADENRQPEKPKLSEAEKRRRQQEDIADRNAKPTAEQILNSGSIEKAREVARQEAQAKRAKQRAAEDAKAKTGDNKASENRQPEKTAAPTSSKAGSENKSANKAADSKTGKTTVQAGAYANRQAAEAQRAKLALMGVTTQIVQVESNGKTIYRVQTRSMDSQRANQVRETLQQNGVNSIPRKQ